MHVVYAARVSLLFWLKASLEWEIWLVPNQVSLHSMFEVRSLTSFFFLELVGFRPLVMLKYMGWWSPGTFRLEGLQS